MSRSKAGSKARPNVDADVYRTTIVSLDGWAPVWGQWRTDSRWNGWLNPHIDAWSVENVLSFLDASDKFEGQEGLRSHDWEGETLVYVETVDGEHYVDRIEPDEDGLYPLGNFGWVWAEDALGNAVAEIGGL